MNNEITIISFLLFVVVIIIYLLFILTTYLNRKRREYLIKNYTDYASILEYHQNRAYNIIYKDRLLIYSLEATKITDEEFEVISKDYVYLLLRMLGPTLEKEFIDLYGYDSLFFNSIEYFNKRYEEDEIRKESVDNLMNQEQREINFK